MIELEYKLNGSIAGTPKNANEIKLISDWNNNTSDNKTEAEISTNALQFVLEDAIKIVNHVSGGLTGGVGVFEGVPYSITGKNAQSGLTTQILDGYIDLAEESTFLSCDEVESVIKKRKNLDWLTARADSFSFSYLASKYVSVSSPEKITAIDYVTIPYILNFRPEETVLATLAVSLFVSVNAAADAIEQVLSTANNFVELLDLLPGTNLGDIIAAGLAALIAVAYLLALLIAIIALTNQLIEQLYPAIRYHRGMKLLRMFEKGCRHLGLRFDSTIFQSSTYKELTFMPTKDEKGAYSKSLLKDVGYPNQQSAIYNFGDFLRVMKQMFNAQIKLDGRTLKFERKDYWDNKSTWILPDVETDQNLRLSSFKYNTDELLSNLMISYQTDVQDENTLENFSGTNVQIITSPISWRSKDFINISGLGEIRMPFARGIVKTTLNSVEKLLKPIVNVVINIVSITTAGLVKLKPVSTRKNVLSLTSHTTSVDKIILMNKDKLATTQLTAKHFYDNFHFIDNFVETTDPATGNKTHNQHKIYTGVEIPFCDTDWAQLISNNRFNTVNGQIGEVLRIEWDINQDKAIIDYKIKELYTKNLKLVNDVGV